jgi:hypothetical protein
MVVISRKLPYVVFAVLGLPIVSLLLYAAIRAGGANDFVVPAIMIFMFGLVFYYLSSLSLILIGDRLIYKVMWRSTEVSVRDIEAIMRGRGPFGVGTTWMIHSKDRARPMLMNVTNFDVHSLRLFGKALLEKKAAIRFSALKL